MDGRGDVAVDWEIAADADFTNIVQTSHEHPTANVKPRAIAEAGLAHSVHLDVAGLEPGRRYYYRFVAGDYEAKGRTKTAPELTAEVPAVAFALANCQSWQGGLYPAYRHIAQDEELDLVVHVGDYTYESGSAPGGPRAFRTPAPTDLAGYRNRYAEYKTDPDLQAAHAAHPWVVTWDDHEVENSYAGTHSWYNTPPEFAKQWAAAYQAYFEHMPLRPSYMLRGREWRNVDLYRRISYGKLAQFCMLDTRQYRTKQPCEGAELAACAERFEDLTTDENGESRRHTILGDAQEDWLGENLTSEGPIWNVISQGVPMFEYDHDPSSSAESYYTDGWDGYVATRNRVFEHLYEDKVPNPIVLTGDLHSGWVADLRYHPRDPNNSFKRRDSITVGTEFVGTSISSGLSEGWRDTYQKALKANPHVKYFDGRTGGYARCDLNADRCRVDFLLADSLNDRQSPMRTVASFEVYPEADPNLRKGAVLVYKERRPWGLLAAAAAGALLLIATLVALFAFGFDQGIF